MNIEAPIATFYIWLKVDNEIEFIKKLYKNYNIKVLAGSFLGREEQGKGFVRLALVYEENLTRDALHRIKACLDED